MSFESLRKKDPKLSDKAKTKAIMDILGTEAARIKAIAPEDCANNCF